MTDVPPTMKALVLNGPNDFEIKELPTPKPKGDEVLCRVKAVAICGTDPKIIAGKFPGVQEGGRQVRRRHPGGR